MAGLAGCGVAAGCGMNRGGRGELCVYFVGGCDRAFGGGMSGIVGAGGGLCGFCG